MHVNFTPYTMAPVPSISQWLAGKTILITGGTGYIGKVLLEKLLRSCPEISKIYLLIREKRGKSPPQRLQDILNSELWSFAKCEYDYSKLVPISVDLGVENMGLSSEDLELLQGVDVIFHAAASIKFTEPFVAAVKANVRFTRDMVDLAKTIKNLQIFVHVSTAYVNCPRTTMDEKVHPPLMDWRSAIKLAESADTPELVAVTEKALGEYPNTYTFTKKMAEDIVWEQRDKFPILIYRPVVVTSLLKEPAPGWTDNKSGLEIVYYAVGKGIIRVLGGRLDSKFNTCPGDVTINGMLAATWKIACYDRHMNEKHFENTQKIQNSHGENNKEAQISTDDKANEKSPQNFTRSRNEPRSNTQISEKLKTTKDTQESTPNIVNSNYFNPPGYIMLEAGVGAVNENPIPDIIWREYYFSVQTPALFWICHLLFNHFPMLVVENIAKCFGQNYPLTKGARTYYVLLTVLFHQFLHFDFNILYDNFNAAVGALSEEDKNEFNTVLKADAESLKKMVIAQTEVFIKLLKERDLPLKVRLAQRKRMFMIDRILRYVIVIFALYFSYGPLSQLIN